MLVFYRILTKIYSKETCKFITGTENRVIAGVTGLTYIATRLSNGYIEEFCNQSEFARNWGLDSSAIIKCLHKTQNAHKGWVFEYKKIQGDD